MLKKILNVEGAKKINKKEQLQIVGAGDPARCEGCGGFPTPNGECFGDAAVCVCYYGLSGQCDY